jgi:predicted RNA-binding protein Jag
MRKMQAIQPEMKAIQDRYANLKATDPAKQKMNTEVMNLYRERGVNPASGCVPMLLTMPVLLAFYSLLSMSIELRGAPFVGWIHDLSAPDPYFVIPLLMGITMFWQQKITPTSGSDPAARDDDHADHVHGDDGVLAERRGVVLDCQSALGHRPAVPDESIDRTARTCARATRQVTIGAGLFMSLTTDIAAFVQSVVTAMGLTLTTTVEETGEGTRINLEGEDGGVLIRRGGEGLQALQHVVATTYRKQLGDDNRIVIDCNGFRRDKDAELRQMALFMAGKARSSGVPQEMGPLNPYERRIVHLAIAEETDVTSESIGDAFMKTVIISAKK